MFHRSSFLGLALLAGLAAPTQGVTFLTENFSNTGALPGPFLEQSALNTPATFNGVNATFPGGGDNGRSYLRTIDDNFIGGSYQAEVTMSIVGGGGGGSVFFGMGVGEPSGGFFQEPRTSPNIYFRGQPNDFSNGGYATMDETSEVGHPIAVTGNGTHRVQMRYDAGAGTVRFAVDKNYAGGAFTPDFVTAARNVADNGFNATNSRVFFGGASNAAFDDLAITALPAAHIAGTPIDGGNGFFGIREVRDNGQINTLTDALNSLASGNGVIINGTAPMINFVDPDNNGGGGHDGGGAAFLSNAVGQDDADFIQGAQGYIRIDNPGTYTFYARGDDGFGLRIPGQNFLSVSDTGDGTAAIAGAELFNDAQGANVNGLGVINLAAGTYKLEYIFFERAGGAFNELYAAMGNFNAGNFNIADFDLIGDVNNGGLALVAAPAAALLPEPATLSLGLLGMMALAARRRRNA